MTDDTLYPDAQLIPDMDDPTDYGDWFAENDPRDVYRRYARIGHGEDGNAYFIVGNRWQLCAAEEDLIDLEANR